jgi:predicted membrane-bound spermidine synthase
MRRAAPLGLVILIQAAVSAASLVVEIVAGRMLAPYVGMSLYTWTAVIAVVLAGFSAGHWAGGRVAERPMAVALTRTGWACLAAALTTGGAALLLKATAGPVLSLVPHPVWGIAALATAVFFLPSYFAGIPAPVLARVAVEGSAEGRQGRALGAVFAAGALGAIAGTLLAGFLFISWLGSTLTLALVTAVYVAAAMVCLWLGGTHRRIVPVLAALLALALAGGALAAPNPCDRETRYFCLRSVDISASQERPVRLMVIDHLAHGISARDLPEVQFTDHGAMLDGLARMRMARKDFASYFIGGGTYSVPRAFAARGIGPITVAEIDPEVTAMAARDFWFEPATATVLHEDARRALLDRPDTTFDVVIGDAFTDIAVPQHLVTREFFQLVRDRLAPDGAFLMNVIDFEDRLHALAALVATLRAVFPSVEVWTEQVRPEPGQRLVFVLVAGAADSPTSTLAARSPDPTTYGAMSQGWVDALVARSGIVLTDDYAPIDRLIGRTD